MSHNGADRADNPRELSQALRIDHACRQVERAWRASRPEPMENLLHAAATEDRTPLLQELLPLEIELRQASGDRPTVGEYTARFAQHASLVAAAFVEVDALAQL